MNRIRFRAAAEADLQSIIAYYEDVAPDSVSNILSDIYRSIDQLVHFPRIGMQVEGRSYRRLVSLKYHFKIAYEVGIDLVIILGIFRYQDREI
jgi:plasmid stabilization system protein ParE